MKTGKLFGIGVGPGDPDLITIKAARILARSHHVFVPRAKIKTESLAYAIAGRYLGKKTCVHELVFPMTKIRQELERCWAQNGHNVADVLKTGEDAVFLTLGDLFLYSTYSYLLRELKRLIPGVKVVSVPGITSFSLASALTGFPIGEGDSPVTVMPVAMSGNALIMEAFKRKGTVVLMKFDRRLPEIIDLMEEAGVIDDAVMVSHAGMKGERIETDLRKLKKIGAEAGYFSVILIHVSERKEQ
jgi:precorrin-2/cobalt-factor-2 C20-methyltransferase